MGSIIRRYAYLDPISYQDPYAMFFHSAGQHGPDRYVVIALYLHSAPAQDPGNSPFQLYQVISAQIIFLPSVCIWKKFFSITALRHMAIKVMHRLMDCIYYKHIIIHKEVNEQSAGVF